MAKTGRPALIDTPEEFQEKAGAFFAECDDSGEPYTITGLMLALGFESRQSFYDYEKRPPFSYVVKRARLRVENHYERRLREEKPTGAIFALKNMGWSDRMDVTSGGEKVGGVLMAPPADIDAELWAQLAKRSQAVGANGNGNGNGKH